MTVVMQEATSKQYCRKQDRTYLIGLRETKFLRLITKAGHKGRERGKVDKRKGCVQEEKLWQVLV
jgi:hypothetical protein